MKCLPLFVSLFCIGLAVQSLAQELSTPQVATKLEDFDLSLQPKLVAEAAPDLWDDHADHLHSRLNLSLWFAGMNGTVGKGDFRSDVDVCFSDIVQHLDLGAVLDFEVGKGRWSAIVLAQYMHLGVDGSGPRGADSDVGMDSALVDFAIAYQFLTTPLGRSQFSLEALVGVRWTFLSLGVEFNDGPLANRHQDQEKNWFDPYVGLRGRIDFDRHWNLQVLGTGGGFGVGSDCAWSAYGQLEYRFDERFSMFAGYRAIAYEYDKDGFIFDVKMHGPVFGFAFRT